MFEPFEIAERIKLCAKEKNITVKSLLKESGVGEKMVSNMSGKNGSFPQSDKLAKIAVALNCTTDYLLGLTDTPNPPALFPEIKTAAGDEQRQRLNDNYDALNQTAQKALVDYSDFMTTKPENLKEGGEDNQNVS